MGIYAKFGHKTFLIAGGYRFNQIQDYFKALNVGEWQVDVIDTGLETSTGGRIKLLMELLEDEFFLTYGDGLANIQIDKLLDYHKVFNKVATVSAVRPPARFGTIELRNGIVTRFAEKDPQDTGWINGGFFCMKKDIVEYLPDSHTPLEGSPMEKLVTLNQLAAFEHDGWWQPMDTLRDKRILEDLWNKGNAPWL